MWSSASAHPLAGLRLLVADDAGAIRQLYADALRRAGADVSEAEDGNAAFAVWREGEEADRSFDALVLDYEMPELDGMALTARLREIGFTGTIVGVSGAVTADEEDRWVAAGCNRVLCKGHSLPDLVSAVAAACGRAW